MKKLSMLAVALIGLSTFLTLPAALAKESDHSGDRADSNEMREDRNRVEDSENSEDVNNTGEISQDDDDNGLVTEIGVTGEVAE